MDKCVFQNKGLGRFCTSLCKIYPQKGEKSVKSAKIVPFRVRKTLSFFLLYHLSTIHQHIMKDFSTRFRERLVLTNLSHTRLSRLSTVSTTPTTSTITILSFSLSFYRRSAAKK